MEFIIYQNYKVKITALEYQKKNPNRVNIFVDGQFKFGVHVNHVVNYSLYKDKEITDSEIKEILRKDIVTRLYERSANLLSNSQKTTEQIRQYIYRIYCNNKDDYKNIEEIGIDVIQDEIVEKLKEVKLLNDYEFAISYIRAYYLIKPVSLFELQGKLRTKGLDNNDIEKAIQDTELDELEMIKFALLKKFRTESIKKGDNKVIQYLSRKGFSWDLISGLIQD